MIILLLLIALLIGWGITCGLIYLICLCFGLTFKLSIATGIWLIMVLLGATFKNRK